MRWVVVTHIVPPVLAVSCAAIADWANAEEPLPDSPEYNSTIAAASIIRPIIEAPLDEPRDRAQGTICSKGVSRINPANPAFGNFLPCGRDQRPDCPYSRSMTTHVRGASGSAQVMQRPGWSRLATSVSP